MHAQISPLIGLVEGAPSGVATGFPMPASQSVLVLNSRHLGAGWWLAGRALN